MINFLLKLFVVREVKKKLTLAYLRTLKAVRKSLLAAILLFLSLQLMVVGLIGSVLTVVYLSPWELESKVYILLCVSMLLFLLPLIALLMFFSEKTWLRMSGVVPKQKVV